VVTLNELRNQKILFQLSGEPKKPMKLENRHWSK
jgi:hypothetical protein